MKKFPLVLLALLLVASRGFAADGVTIFRNGLQAFQANGPDALLNSWYGGREDSDLVGRVRQRLFNATQSLGPVVDTEVFAPRDLGRHVQRLYGVIYFQKRPLWLRAELYSINGVTGIISLEFSTASEDILPLEWAASRN